MSIVRLQNFWMYAGVSSSPSLPSLYGSGQINLAGYGVAILSQIALLIARKTWLVIWARRSE